MELFLEGAFMPLPGVVRSEFASDYSPQLAIVTVYALCKASKQTNMFLPCASCLCDYVQLELMRNLHKWLPDAQAQVGALSRMGRCVRR